MHADSTQAASRKPPDAIQAPLQKMRLLSHTGAEAEQSAFPKDTEKIRDRIIRLL